ncbi:hypothetical protein [Streptomyces sp. NPDC052496]|uniref:hypothetical protein n=1 Tax=Streptomyces sp. NPDC052496 TaxID=3154951 RepID=UPI00343AFA8B
MGDMSKNRPERERRAQRAAQESAPAAPDRSAGEAAGVGESYVAQEGDRWVSHLGGPGTGKHRKGPGPVPRTDATE